MAIKTALDLFVHELSDIYSAERQLTLLAGPGARL